MVLVLILILLLRWLGHLLVRIRTRLPALAFRLRSVILGATSFIMVGRVIAVCSIV
jgi:hypothetical protein